MRYVVCENDLKSEFFFLALNNIHFLRVLGKSLRNSAPPTILSNTPSWYFLQFHQRYSLQYATLAIHASTSLTLPMLAHHPRCHVTLARRLSNQCQHINHTCTSLTLARHHSKHTAHTSTPLTYARGQHYSRQHKQHAISGTPRYPTKLLKLLVFSFTASLSTFVEVWKTAIEKLNFFFRENQSALLKIRPVFQKQMRIFFTKAFFQKKTFQTF